MVWCNYATEQCQWVLAITGGIIIFTIKLNFTFPPYPAISSVVFINLKFIVHIIFFLQIKFEEGSKSL